MKANKKITDKQLMAKKLENKQKACAILEGIAIGASGAILSAVAVRVTIKLLGLDKKETAVTIPSEDIEEAEVTEEE